MVFVTRLRIAGVLAATLSWSDHNACGQPSHGAGPDDKVAAASAGLPPLNESEFDYEKARHLATRAGFGATTEEVGRLQAMGLRDAVSEIVEPGSQNENALAEFATQARTPLVRKKLQPDEQRRLNQQRRKADQAQLQKLRAWWLQRMIAAPNALEEKLVLFWHGHFATEYQVVRDSHALYAQNQLFRRHAFDYAALLRGIVRDPAMLRYLDNNRNVRGRPNENLAREIMELFSMGAGNYTEEDIREAARALTGYTFDRDSQTFRFAKSKHDDGEKTIFGNTGDWNGDQVVDMILQRPATSRFVAVKLFAFFAHDDPPQETIERMAGLIRAHDYKLAPVLSNLFMSDEFFGERAVHRQVKSPIQLVVGTYRALGVRETDFAAAYEAARNMGQDLFQPPNVRGWPGGRDWMNTRHLFARYNGMARLINGAAKSKGARNAAMDLVGLLDEREFAGAEEVADYLIRSLLCTPLSGNKRQALIAVLDGKHTLPPSRQWAEDRANIDARLRAAVVLLVCTAEYQLT